MIYRKVIDNKTYILGYHTQECHGHTLTKPIKCEHKEAWLGVGYYFWVEEEFAHYWGIDEKKDTTGVYEIYSAYVPEENLLNTSFNEEYYFIFQEKINNAIEHLKNKWNTKKIDIRQVHRFLASEVWPLLKIDGILYDDLPHNTKKRTYSEITPLHYKKRIQIVIFEKENLIDFKLYRSNLC